MNKRIILSVVVLFMTISQVFAQKYFTRNGHIWFFSEAPLENIEAHNYQVTSVMDAETGDMVFSVLIKGFEFEKALMQEHFNEKYLHSDKYPKATFKGKIEDFDKIDLSKDGEYEIVVSGDLTIHGITKEVNHSGTFTVKEGKIMGKSKFPVTLADYEVTIPTVVKDNIAKVVDVHVDLEYTPYEN